MQEHHGINTAARSVRLLAQRLVGLIDIAINKQVNEILHHPCLQKLEASWRGLAVLVMQATQSSYLKVRVLNINSRELERDVSQAIEFDQSQLFKKIYSEELDQSGGQPFGLIVGDYSFTHKPSNEFADSISVLKNMAKIAAAAFTPCIFAIDSSHFGINNFGEYPTPFNLKALFRAEEYRRWNLFRHEEELRYIGLLAPRVLMRKPYNRDQRKLRNRLFHEAITQHNDYLWGNPAFIYAAQVMQCFSDTGWHINLPITTVNQYSAADAVLQREAQTPVSKDYLQPLLELHFTSKQETMLNRYGISVIRDNTHERTLHISHSQSLQIPESHNKAIASENALLISQLHYNLCACRFAHYVKIMLRDKVGSFLNKEDCQIYLHNWINQYCTSNTDNSDEVRRKYPLRDAKVYIQDMASAPGKYHCQVYIQPHHPIDVMQAQLKLNTQIQI